MSSIPIGSSRLAILSVSIALMGLWATTLRAQMQPIYPAYEGYVKNPDGSLTLSFAYFSHNPKPVTVLAGPGNSFAPHPADRLQPTTFLPGHRRFQCVMVVGPEFDGKLRWTLSHAGSTAATSENMLQYSWEIEDASQRQVLRGVDAAHAPRGVCLNRPPLVRLLGPAGGAGTARSALAVTLPEGLRLFGSVEDEGLPRGGRLSVAWRQVSGPGTVTFADPTASRTRASFSAPGTYRLELWASDSEQEGRTEVTVVVNPKP